MQRRLSLVTSGLLLLVACSGSSDQEQVTRVPSAVEVEVCGALVDAPGTFTKASTRGKHDRMLLSRSDGTTVAISCGRKRNSGPLTLRGELDWIVDSTLDVKPTEVHELDSSSLQRR